MGGTLTHHAHSKKENTAAETPQPDLTPAEAAAYAEIENLKTPEPSPNVSVWQAASDETPGTGRSTNKTAAHLLVDPRSPNEDISRTPILIADGKDGKDLKGLRKKLVTQQAGLHGNPPTPGTPNENSDPASAGAVGPAGDAKDAKDKDE